MASPSRSPAAFQPSTLIRLAPLRLSEIPAHPDLPSKTSEDETDHYQPELLPFIATLLSDGLAFLSAPVFAKNFKHHSNRRASPSVADVEVLTYSIPASQLKSQVPWAPRSPSNGGGNGSGGGGRSGGRSRGSSNANGSADPRVTTAAVKRSQPSATTITTATGGTITTITPTATLQTEHWFARRSQHANVSSKSTTNPGHASWDEFVYGLRDNHSEHERDFTPTLYDARKVVDWSGQVAKLEAEGSLARTGFRDVTAAMYEMCHDIPPPMKPRCFGVFVVTASVIPPPRSRRGAAGAAARGRSGSTAAGTGTTAMAVAAAADTAAATWEDGDEERFIAVTVPVYLGYGTKKAFYANWRNLSEGENEKQKRDTVQGVYCAVETCTLRRRRRRKGSNADEEKEEEDQDEIDWLMATASDAKGVLPMWMQKLALPGTLPKDVGYFIKWIQGVDDGVIDGSLSPA